MGLQTLFFKAPKKDIVGVSRARLSTLAKIGNVASYLDRANSKISLSDPGSIFPKSFDGNAKISRPSWDSGDFVKIISLHVG